MIVLFCIFTYLLVVSGSSRKLARLAGGYQTSIGEYPFLVASLHPDIRCTASIIHPEWVLGAAHCYILNGMIVNEYDVILSAGIVDFNDTYSETRQDRRGEAIHVHPYFEEVKISGSDLGLVKVEPFVITNEVRPILLSSKPFVMNKQVSCTAAGWGDTSENKQNTVLHKLKVVAVQSKKSCHGLSARERKNMLCLRVDHGRGLCDGDSGGPLICNGNLVGVAHQVYVERNRYKGPSDMLCGSKNIIHTYMFTCPYLNWIHSYVPQVPSKPDKCFEGSKSIRNIKDSN